MTTFIQDQGASADVTEDNIEGLVYAKDAFSAKYMRTFA